MCPPLQMGNPPQSHLWISCQDDNIFLVFFFLLVILSSCSLLLTLDKLEHVKNHTEPFSLPSPTTTDGAVCPLALSSGLLNRAHDLSSQPLLLTTFHPAAM